MVLLWFRICFVAWFGLGLAFFVCVLCCRLQLCLFSLLELCCVGLFVWVVVFVWLSMRVVVRCVVVVCLCVLKGSRLFVRVLFFLCVCVCLCCRCLFLVFVFVIVASFFVPFLCCVVD